MSQIKRGEVNPGRASRRGATRGAVSLAKASRGEINSLEVLLHQLKQQRRRTARGLANLENFLPVQGELALGPALELALLTLAHHRYRGIPQWRVQQTYSFTCDGIFLCSYVEAGEPGSSIRFTPEEAIAIARHISQQTDPQESDW